MEIEDRSRHAVDAFEPLGVVDGVAAGPRCRQFLLQPLAVSQRRGRERFQRAAAKPFAAAFVAPPGEDRLSRCGGIERRPQPHFTADLQRVGATKLFEHERLAPRLDQQLHRLAGRITERPQRLVTSQHEALVPRLRTSHLEQLAREGVGLRRAVLETVAQRDERLEDPKHEVGRDVRRSRRLRGGDATRMPRNEIENRQRLATGGRGEGIEVAG